MATTHNLTETRTVQDRVTGPRTQQGPAMGMPYKSKETHAGNTPHFDVSYPATLANDADKALTRSS